MNKKEGDAFLDLKQILVTLEHLEEHCRKIALDLSKLTKKKKAKRIKK